MFYSQIKFTFGTACIFSWFKFGRGSATSNLKITAHQLSLLLYNVCLSLSLSQINENSEKNNGKILINTPTEK